MIMGLDERKEPHIHTNVSSKVFISEQLPNRIVFNSVFYYQLGSSYQ